MPRSYPPEFRRKVLDLIAAGRTVASISDDLEVSGQTIYTWRNQDQVDRGERPGVTSTEQAELARRGTGSPNSRPSSQRPSGPTSC